MAASISEFFYTKNMESVFLKESKSTKKNQAVGSVGCGCVARVSDFLFLRVSET